jgi:uncharacterized protein (DUF58 family)
VSLSRRALAAAAVILLLAIAGIWSGEPLQGVWRWPAVLLLVFIVWERLSLPRHFVIQRDPAGTLPLGKAGGYSLAVSNPGKRALTLETQADHPAALEGENPLQRWRLQPGETQTRRVSVVPVALGASLLGPLYLRVLGGFGLCWWTRRDDDGAVVTVVPAMLRHGPAAGIFRTGLSRSRFKPGSGAELLDLRDYRHGDPLRTIDWKATARRGKPIVRRFERQQRLEIAVLIDCGRASRIHVGQMDRLHHYVNVAARLAELAAYRDDRIAGLAYAQRVLACAPLAGGAPAVQRIRGMLVGLAAADEEPNPLSAALEVKRLLKHRGLVVFLTDIEQPEAASQLIRAVQLLATRHQVLVASVQDEAVAGIARQRAIHWLDPYRQFAALEYARGRALTQRKLQRAGVAVLAAAPQHLDREVLDYYRQQRDRIGS